MKARLFVELTDPWSYVGATRFERAAALFTIITGEPVAIAYTPTTADRLVPASEAAAAARISGIDLNTDDVVPADTTDAWRLLTWALQEEQAPGQQRDLVHQLWRAHFLEGADIADRFVLVSRAGLAGFAMDRAEAALESDVHTDQVALQRSTALEIGAMPPPFVVIDDSRTLAGLHSQDDYVQALHALRS